MMSTKKHCVRLSHLHNLSLLKRPIDNHYKNMLCKQMQAKYEHALHKCNCTNHARQLTHNLRCDNFKHITLKILQKLSKMQFFNFDLVSEKVSNLFADKIKIEQLHLG